MKAPNLNPTIRQDLFHPTRLLYAVVFATLFVIIAYFTPKLWIQYGPIQYYKVEQPALTDRHIYKACDKIVVTIVRTSLITDNAHSIVQIYLVGITGLSKSIPLYNNNIIIEPSDHQTFYLTYTIPCDATDGQYYLKAVIDYHVQGIPKVYSWATEAFSVDHTAVE